MEQLTKMYNTSHESCVDWAITAVGFMLNSVVLCWQSVFEVGTCMIQYSKIQQLLPFGGKTNLIKKIAFSSFNNCLFLPLL